jgi:hypothetical protein
MKRKRKGKEPDEFGDDDLDFEYEGEPPHPNLLDYRHMFITMTRWAYSDTSCLNVIIAAVLVVLACFILLTLYGIVVNSLAR